MKRQLWWFVTLCFLGSTIASDLDEVVIPRKTEIFIELLRSINSKTAREGDKFSSILHVPVAIDDQIVLPVGTFVIGHVVYRKSAGHFKGKAQLLLGFDTVILPDGKTRQIRAAVESADGYSTDPTKETGELEVPGSQKEEVGEAAAVGAVTGVITGATVGIFTGQTLKGAGLGAAYGAAGGALLGLLKKGEEVELQKGSGLTIQLQEDVRFVKPEPSAQGQSLTPG